MFLKSIKKNQYKYIFLMRITFYKNACKSYTDYGYSLSSLFTLRSFRSALVSYLSSLVSRLWSLVSYLSCLVSSLSSLVSRISSLSCLSLLSLLSLLSSFLSFSLHFVPMRSFFFLFTLFRCPYCSLDNRKYVSCHHCI